MQSYYNYNPNFINIPSYNNKPCYNKNRKYNNNPIVTIK